MRIGDYQHHHHQKNEGNTIHYLNNHYINHNYSQKKLAIAWGPDLYYNLQKQEESYNNNVTSNDSNNDDIMNIDDNNNNFLCPLITIDNDDEHHNHHITKIDILTSISREQHIPGLIPTDWQYY